MLNVVAPFSIMKLTIKALSIPIKNATLSTTLLYIMTLDAAC